MSSDLFEEHAAIIEAAEAFLAALKREPRIGLDEVSRLRVKLSSLIRRHRETEEEFIFGPLTREGGLSKLPHLEPFVQDLMREKVKYSEHVRKWTPQAIEKNWSQYVASVEMLVTSVKRVIRDEESRVYSAVLGLSPAQSHGHATRGRT